MRLGVENLPDAQECTDLHPGPLGVRLLGTRRRAGPDRDLDVKRARADLLDAALAAAKEVRQICDVGGLVKGDPQRVASLRSYLPRQVSALARGVTTLRWCSSVG